VKGGMGKGGEKGQLGEQCLGCWGIDAPRHDQLLQSVVVCHARDVFTFSADVSTLRVLLVICCN